MRIHYTDEKYKCIIINLLDSSYFLILDNTAVFVINIYMINIIHLFYKI